jgi:hypothetical protein
MRGRTERSAAEGNGLDAGGRGGLRKEEVWAGGGGGLRKEDEWAGRGRRADDGRGMGWRRRRGSRRIRSWRERWSGFLMNERLEVGYG